MANVYLCVAFDFCLLIYNWLYLHHW